MWGKCKFKKKKKKFKQQMFGIRTFFFPNPWVGESVFVYSALTS